MKIVDEVEYDLFKMVAQTIIMRGGDIERIPHNYNRIRKAALDLGFIEEDKKSVAKQEEKVLNKYNGRI
jgi:hypothetical protein